MCTLVLLCPSYLPWKGALWLSGIESPPELDFASPWEARKGSWPAMAGLLACYLQALRRRWLVAAGWTMGWTHWRAGCDRRQACLSPGNTYIQAVFATKNRAALEHMTLLGVSTRSCAYIREPWVPLDCQGKSPRAPDHRNLAPHLHPSSHDCESGDKIGGDCLQGAHASALKSSMAPHWPLRKEW